MTKVDERVYAAMRPKEAFIALQAAYAREDFAEATRIGAALPRLTWRGIDPEITGLNKAANALAWAFAYDLAKALGTYRMMALAAETTHLILGTLLVEDDEPQRSTDQDSPGLATELFREEQEAAAGVVIAIMDALTLVCEEDVGLSPEQLVRSCAGWATDALIQAAQIKGQPDPGAFALHLNLYRILWRGAVDKAFGELRGEQLIERIGSLLLHGWKDV